jgi:CRP-like cAMP-binding protein
LTENVYTNYITKQLCKAGLTEDKAYQISGEVLIRSFEEQQTIYSRGQEVSHWCYVINGTVGASVVAARGEISLTQIYPSGSWFGEQSILNNKPSFSDYICMSDVDLLVIPTPVFADTFENVPEFMKNICYLLAWREQLKEQMLTILKTGTAEHKTIVSLAYLVESLSFQLARPTNIPTPSTLFVHGKQHMLASLCGVSRSVFSALVQRLIESDFLSSRYGRLEFHKIAAWLNLSLRIRKNHYSIQNFVEHSAFDELESCAAEVLQNRQFGPVGV